MSEQTKSGKRPISEARSGYSFGEFTMDNDMLTIPPQVRKEIEEQGFEARWIDRAKYIQNSGHYRTWQPYKRIQNDFDTLSLKENLLGKSPEGYVQSGSTILAVRPKEFGVKHRAKLKQKAERLSNGSLLKSKAAELRESIKEAGLSERVIEGYEDDEK